MTFHTKVFLAIGIMMMPFVSTGAHAYSNGEQCAVDPAWISSPSMPVEVKKSGSDGSSNFCDFYQFSWQAYFYLMSPVKAGSDTRQFQVAKNYPLLEFTAEGQPANSCDETVTENTLRTMLNKTPILTHQAGSGVAIFDQNENVVYYDVRFNKEMCNLTGSAVEMQKTNTINFPAGTTELKFAWKVLTESEVQSGTFLTQTPPSGTLKGVTLGLVGMHIAIATNDHPEFVWASYEQSNNAPNCGTASTKAWSFTSKQCASNSVSCDFNQAKKTDKLKGMPTEICRVFPDGTADGDLKAKENRDDINSTNQQVASLLNTSSDPNMKLLQNYFTLGGIWLSDTQKGYEVSNQRGSLRLANPVAETTYQHVDLTSKTFVSNCFGCHNYNGTAQPVNNNVTSGNLSHIFFDVLTGQGKAVDIQSGTFLSRDSASQVCKTTCEGFSLTWNGQWTTEPGSKSVCGCKLN